MYTICQICIRLIRHTRIRLNYQLYKYLLMNNKLLHVHWFDKDMMKILDRYELQEASAKYCLDRGTSLAQAAFKTSVAMVILADFQSYRIKSEAALDAETVEKLFDLAHLLKEVEPEMWTSFYDQPFFRDSDMWTAVKSFRFFCCQPVVNANEVTLGWMCLFDTQTRIEDLNMLATLKTMADMVMDELELRVQIKRSNQLQNEIIHLAAHDLKNPLSGILGIADHIKKQRHDGEQIEEICDLIKDSSRRMLTILDDILKSGFLESGKIQLKVSAHGFGELVQEVLSANQAAAEKKKQRFNLCIAQPVHVLIDRHRMMEVLDNLVNNAVKYAPRDTDIEIRVFEENSQAVFAISNQGVGLSVEDKNKIFHKFSKLSAKPTGGETSTGLGLSIVKMLTEMHGGHIQAESEGIDCGATFTLRLPALAEV